MSALLSILLLLAPEPAEEVLQAFREGKDLKALASRDEPDPWLVADELCGRGEFDAAEAFAKAAPRKDTERLPGYVAAQRGAPTDPAARRALAAIRDILASRNGEAALAACEGVAAGADVTGARLLHARAIALQLSGSASASAEAYVACAEAMERVGWLARASGLMEVAASVLNADSDADVIRDLREKKLAVDERRGAHSSQISTLSKLAGDCVRRRESDRALAYLDRWLRLAEETGDRKAIATALLNLGVVHADHGAHPEALRCRVRSTSLFEELGEREMLAHSLHALAMTHSRLGHHEQARATLEKELELRRTLDDRAGEANALGDIGWVLGEAARYSEALPYQERALALFDALGDRRRVALMLGNIGGTHRELGAFRKALDYSERAVRVAEGLGDRERELAELQKLAATHLAMGRYADALECWRRALSLAEALRDRPRTAQCIGDIGLVHLKRGELLKALDHFERARVIQQEGGDRLGAAAGAENLGVAHFMLGDDSAALSCFEIALAIEEEFGRLDRIATTLGNMSGVLLHRGDTARANACVKRAVALAEGIGTPAGTARALRQLGRCHLLWGELSNAFARIERALGISESIGDRQGTADALLLLAAINGDTGELEQAKVCAERALSVFDAAGDRFGVVEALILIGRNRHRAGDSLGAVEFLERALSLVEEMGTYPQIASTLHSLAVIYNDRRDFVKSRSLVDEALRLAEELDDREGIASAIQNLGSLLMDRGEYQAAIARVEESLRLAERLGLLELQVTAHLTLTQAHSRRGAPAAALATAREASEKLANLSRGLAETEGAGVRGKFAEIFELGAAAAVRLEDVPAAFRFLEEGRAGALLESLAARERLQGAILPESLLRAEETARRRERVALARYREALEDGADADARWKDVETARGELTVMARRIQREAKAQAGILYPAVDSLPQAQSALGRDEALVLYGGGAALVVTQGDARIVELGDLGGAADAFRRAISRPDERGLGLPPHEQPPFLTKRVASVLVESLRLGKSVRRVLISADGLLAYLPFCTLTDREVVYVPSGTTFRLLREEERRFGRRVLAVGDPVSGQGRLPASADEAKAVGDVTLLGEQATVSGLQALLRTQERWRAVHFACHGLMDPERPALSALALTPEGDEDGQLRCLDVYRMRIPADLVVLSACETAKGKVYRTEGVMGWTRAFMFAGAPRVIVSLWKVDDEATRALMEAFYAHWRTMPAATALKKAQEHVAAQEKWKHPYFWAAWQLWGLPE